MCARDPAACLARLIFLAAVVVSAACDSPGIPESRVPAALQLVSGDTQTAVAGEALTDSLEVRVLNRRGEPVPGVEVEFSPATGGGTLHPARARTDANGTARAAWTLGPAAGPQTAQGRVRGGRLDALVFTARATPGAPARLVEVSGNHQAGTVGEPLPRPLVVRMLDANGNGVAGVPVSWESVQDDAVFSEGELTDASGYARAALTLGTRAGSEPMTVGATFQLQTVVFEMMVMPGPVTEIVLEGRVPELSPASARIAAVPRDEYGNTVWTASDVRWTSSAPDVAIIDPDPLASRATVTTRGTGTVWISASVGDVSATAGFHVKAVAGRFGIVDTGVPGAGALNDRGEVARLIDRTTLGIWSGGSEREFDISPIAVPCSACHEGNVIAGFNAEGAVLVMRMYFANAFLYYDNHGWLWKDGLGGTIPGTLTDISDAGQVVGYTSYRFPAPWGNSAYVWQGGQVVPLSGIADPEVPTFATAINNRAQIAVNASRYCPPGQCVSFPSRAYVWEAGHVTPVPRPTPACQAWEAVDINDAGHVLVRCASGSDAAFVWNGASFTDVGLAHASALNDRGEVVGWEADGPYLWRNGVAIRLIDQPPVNAAYRTTVLINNRGQIVLNLSTGAYLLTPLP